MGETLPYVRDAGQEDRFILMTRICAEYVFVPVIWVRAILHQVAARIVRPGKSVRIHPHQFALHVVNEDAFGIVLDDVWRDEHDMRPGERGGAEEARARNQISPSRPV